MDHDPHASDSDGREAALGALFGADVAAAIGRAVEAALDAGDGRVLAQALVGALTAAGAEGAELWHFGSAAQGWRRVAAAGRAVPGAAACAAGTGRGYPGAVAAARDAGLALVFHGDHPGSDRREALEDLAEALLALVGLLGGDLLDADGAPRPGPNGPECLD